MQILNIFHVLIAIALVAFILIQKGQGATAGAAFGSGASGTVFGARGAGNFLSRTTWVLAGLFCTISLVMAVMVSRSSGLPENDLGVVGTSQPQEQTMDQTPLDTQDLNLLTPAIESDVGGGDAVNDLPGDLPVGTSGNTSGDLPMLDDGVINNPDTEGAQSEEPVSDGS
jgi:preprotein translocase subunit SecG